MPDPQKDATIQYSLDVGEFRWSRLGWFAHSNKSRMISLLILSAVLYITYLIVMSYKKNTCIKKKMKMVFLATADIVLIVFFMKYIKRHTLMYFTKPKNKFTGINALQRQHNRKLKLMNDNMRRERENINKRPTEVTPSVQIPPETIKAPIIHEAPIIREAPMRRETPMRREFGVRRDINIDQEEPVEYMRPRYVVDEPAEYMRQRKPVEYVRPRESVRYVRPRESIRYVVEEPVEYVTEEPIRYVRPRESIRHVTTEYI